ncbi:MAG TPA: hypothetical protein IAC00_09030 [Candidatus Limivicinus faecipullorum]|mgnify:FL=1|nr:hypothetical protein [Candidatus Limivicinus faecipullorum]
MVPVLMPLLAFGLPALVIMRNEKRPVRRPWLFSLGSFAAALAALCQELWVFCRRAGNGDVSGILDTAGAVLVIGIGISLVCLALNLIALALSYGKD